MNDNQLIVEFIKYAAVNGVPVEGIRQLVEERFGAFAEKHASQPEQTLDAVVTSLLADCGLQKSAQSTGYVHGLLAEAIDAGASFQHAVKIAETALVEARSSVTKQAANEGFAEYADGFLKAALDAGYSDGQAQELLQRAVYQKTANMAGSEAMFKQPLAPTGGMPPGMDAMLGAGGPPSMDGAQSQLDPGTMQQIVAMLSAGLGGQQQQQPPTSLG